MKSKVVPGDAARRPSRKLFLGPGSPLYPPSGVWPLATSPRTRMRFADFTQGKDVPVVLEQHHRPSRGLQGECAMLGRVGNGRRLGGVNQGIVKKANFKLNAQDSRDGLVDHLHRNKMLLHRVVERLSKDSNAWVICVHSRD